MIDIHNHLLYGIDDGSKSLEDSIRVLKDLESVGYTDIILTPHYIINTKYNSKKEDNLKKLNELKKVVKENKIKINLYLGNEIFIDYDLLDYLNKGLISSMNNTKYLLIELPMSGEFNGYLDIFNELINKGYKIILAHPERYNIFQKNYKLIKELEEIGVAFQCNIESEIGGYGKRAKRLFNRLLKDNKISFLATDIHHKKRDYSKWEKAKKEIIKRTNEKEWKLLTSKNPSKLIG